ncbi:protein kinase domain-containing protein [Phytomonospora endophytica]|uniref:Serine/threonine protein kinase n=1 Tax=Phytomonospora endophytica TaxID=714109 RepID=A0A841FHU2_9ACTN|nr:protein kinase [Phytomonospora endophytica]MBB6032229.1 hypothetical protein [Phytomonospora endophytica]GIG68578.1 hypothetical protein Pen01_48730 [Phytomonospora endophytica]
MTAARVTLSLVRGRLDTAEYVFEERATCLLGRADDCSPRLPDDEHHRTVSRHHCLLDINPPAARIRDFGSLNGTYVNETRIGRREPGQTPEEASSSMFPEHDLADGDEIRLGDTVFRVGVTTGEQGPRRTLVLVHCTKCGRDLGDADGVEDYVCASCQAEPAAVLRLLLELAKGGRRELAPIAGYELIRELGRGGMGAVHLARHEATDEVVALKVMLPRVAASEQARARFLREVALTRALRHPNIAALHDAGFGGGTFFFTMEYCSGGGLDDRLTKGPLPPDEAVSLIRQVLAGLEHAHAHGVVHRDLSPGNILLRPREDGSTTAKVADFGLAKAFDQAGLSGLTRTGTAAGKPYFLSRRQVVNFRDATPIVDVWAAAACLYRALSGTYPRDFPRGRDPWHVVLQEPAVPIRERGTEVPGDLAMVVDRALREDPGEGYATAREFAEALATTTRS